MARCARGVRQAEHDAPRLWEPRAAARSPAASTVQSATERAAKRAFLSEHSGFRSGRRTLVCAFAVPAFGEERRGDVCHARRPEYEVSQKQMGRRGPDAGRELLLGAAGPPKGRKLLPEGARHFSGWEKCLQRRVAR